MRIATHDSQRAKEICLALVNARLSFHCVSSATVYGFTVDESTLEFLRTKRLA